MRCTEEQFNAIRPKLEKAGLTITLPTFLAPTKYLTNYYCKKLGNVTDVSKERALEDTNNLFEEWNEQTFLEYCGIKSFVLPEKWYVEITAENRDVLLGWARRQPNYVYKWESLFKPGYYALSKHPDDGSYLWTSHRDLKNGYKRIEFEQFRKYVLNQEPIKQEMKTTKTKVTEVLRIHAAACLEWKDTIAKEYLPRVDKNQEIEFTQEEIDKMFKAATTDQVIILESIFKGRFKSIEWDKIKTGSRVMIKNTGTICVGIKKFDLSKPVDVVFFRTPHFVNSINWFHQVDGGGCYLHCTFHQDGKFTVFDAEGVIDYIEEVIEY